MATCLAPATSILRPRPINFFSGTSMASLTLCITSSMETVFVPDLPKVSRSARLARGMVMSECDSDE